MRQVIGPGLGASEIGAVAGLSPWKTPLEVWLEKTGQAPAFAGSPQTEWGHWVEPSLRGWYVESIGRSVMVPTESLYHRDHGFVRATPDGIVLRDNDEWDYLLEAKKVGWRQAHRWGEPGSDHVPSEYLAQTQIQMAVTGLDRAEVVATIGGEPPEVWVVNRDGEFIEMLLACAVEFWGFVERREPPPVDGSSAWAGYIAERYPFSRDDYAKASAEDEANLAAVLALRTELTRIEQAEGRLLNLLKASIADCAGLETSRGLLHWKPQKGRTAVDWQAIAVNLAHERGVPVAELNARIAANTTHSKPSRPLRLPRGKS